MEYFYDETRPRIVLKKGKQYVPVLLTALPLSFMDTECGIVCLAWKELIAAQVWHFQIML